MSKELLLQHQEHTNPVQIEEKEDEEKRIIHNNIEQERMSPAAMILWRYHLILTRCHIFARSATSHF